MVLAVATLYYRLLQTTEPFHSSHQDSFQPVMLGAQRQHLQPALKATVEGLLRRQDWEKCASLLLTYMETMTYMDSKEARPFTVTFKAADCFRTSGFKQSGNSMDDIWIHDERFCLMARSISCRRLVPWLLPGIMLKQWGQQDLPRQSWLFHFFKECGCRVFLLQASTRIQVRNTHYYFTCLEMEIIFVPLYKRCKIFWLKWMLPWLS
ncbi:uncharacterized protein LOC123387034 [Mustela putorius furo]|uniref:Uncharacterized protein LOC123387034 n=1 Tax=Mustela putorius furo TaxID=9669 RepID=A0A8U0R6K7_MUSPF|nr:uncharacterized protein LOC123387034 [Mustela putorius furo]XP_044918815.1 uncharacterized protein LOC123387034 [Mustela putorius furo]